MSKLVEVASLPATLPVKMSKYLIALRLSEMNKENNLGRKYYDLAKKYYEDITPEEMTRGGLSKFTYFNRMAPSYGWLETFRSDVKHNLRARLIDNPNIPKDESNALYQGMLFFFRKDNAEANVKQVYIIANKISASFASEIMNAGGAIQIDEKKHRGKIEGLYDSLEDIVQKITGKKGLKIPADVLKKAKASNDKAYLVQQYNAKRREIMRQYDLDLSQYVSGKDKPPFIAEAYKHMEGLGYDTHRIIKPSGPKIPLRVGITAGVIEYYTDDGRKIDGGIPVDAEKVNFMSTYDPADGSGAYLSYTTPTAAGITRKYTTAHKNKATKEKFDKADAVAENIDKVVLKWAKDLASKDLIAAMCSSVAMIIYRTGMRVGTSVKARSISGEKSYGALTLLCSQVSIKGNRIEFKYAGKKQVQQHYVLTVEDKADKALRDNLAEFKLDKKGSDLLFSYETMSGKWKRLQPSELNAYLKKTGYPAGIHKIRHVRGTNLAVSLLNKLTWRPSEKDRSLANRQRSAEDFIKEKILAPVAQLLGHRSKDGKDIWSTSIQNYVNPLPIIEWFKQHNLRVPKWVPKNLSSD